VLTLIPDQLSEQRATLRQPVTTICPSKNPPPASYHQLSEQIPSASQSTSTVREASSLPQASHHQPSQLYGESGPSANTGRDKVVVVVVVVVEVTEQQPFSLGLAALRFNTVLFLFVFFQT